VSIKIPAGTYDWCITNPTPGDRIWIASSNGTIGGRYDDFTFEAGNTYTFHVYFGGSNDATDLTVTPSKNVPAKMAVASSDCRAKVQSVMMSDNFSNAGVGFGPSNNQMTRDWYYYDNGINDDAIGLTSGGSFYWGIMLPAGTYEGNTVSAVAYYDYSAHTGTFMIYQGGTSAPQTLLYTQPYSVFGSGEYLEIEMTEPVAIDETLPLWVVMHNDNGQYVAAIDSGIGVNYGSCISTDGSSWYTTVSAASSGQIDGNWNLRVYVEQGGGGGTGDLPIKPNKFNVFFDGEFVDAVSDANIWIEAPDFDYHIYTVVWIDENYNVSCANTIEYAAIHDDAVIEEGVIKAMYPNPTNGDLHVYAPAMKRVSIINTLGQMVYDQAVSTDQMVIDMSQFEAGVYMVNVVTENGSSVKRVTVTK
jgi:hypothetical protein